MKKFLSYTVLIVFVLYLLACVNLYFKQEDFLFFCQKSYSDTYQNLKHNLPQSEFQFTTKDNVILSGWYSEQDNSKPLYIYYGGNGEDITASFEFLLKITNRSLLAVNYRGYGYSGGRPTQKEIFSDALEILDAMQIKFKDRQINLMGRSLGSGVACFVASSRKVNGIVLITPYDSILAVAQKQFSAFPVGLLLKHPFNSYLYSKNIKAPALFLLASNDEVVPAANSQRLIDHWVSPKTVFIIPSSSHNTILDQPSIKNYLNEFFLKIEKE